MTYAVIEALKLRECRACRKAAGESDFDKIKARR